MIFWSARNTITGAMTSYRELAEVCIRRGEMDEVITLCEEALKSGSDVKNIHADSIRAYINGVLHVAKGEISEAEDALNGSPHIGSG